MFGYDWPRFHAAVNDLPAALLLVTVLFDLGAWLTKRESLKAAALWTLWAGVIGGGGAASAARHAPRHLSPTASLLPALGTPRSRPLSTRRRPLAALCW